MESLLGKHWHHLPHAEVVDILGGNVERGLDRFEVETRASRFGPNAIPAAAGTPLWRAFLMQFHQPLIYILLVAGGVTLIFKDWVDSAVIFGVVLMNAVIGFLHEAKAVRAIEALRRSLSSTAAVFRGGEWRQIPAEQLVPGDLVQLQAGDKVPADLRLVKTRNLQIEEAALTGESVPTEKNEALRPRDTILADRGNMAWSGTLVTAGQGTGVVVATGGNTELGRISELIARSEPLETPLTRKIADFSRILMYAIIVFALLAFAAGIARGESIIDTFKAAVALAVGAIPEGLPAAVTILLAIGMHRMSMRNAVIRKLPAVETLGSTTVICSDKTGTLTQNQMTVREVRAGGETYRVTGEGYDPAGEMTLAPHCAAVSTSGNEALRQTLLAGLLCNDSRVVQQEQGFAAEGDPTEAALLVSAGKGGFDPAVEVAAAHRIDALPFESEFQYMATLHEVQGERIVYVKGSVEKIVERCTFATAEQANAILQDASDMAGQGLRVLAFARLKLTGAVDSLTHEQLTEGLEFLGLQGMIDPPRAEAKAAIRVCQQAGVLVKMITGDHALTAEVISRQLGIRGADGAPNSTPAVTGRQLAELTEDEWITVAHNTAVFARVSPDQKLRLVRSLQARGHVVAMTGDGVNDAPALRQADIGVAMGITGTEVSKEAADIVLLDDNFATIEAAVEEGRGVFDNLTKFIVWTLPTNLGEGLVILVAVLAGFTLPILPTQILWINMTTAVFLGLMLAFEPKERQIMDRPPRRPNEPVLTGTLLRRIVLVGFLLLVGSFGLFKWALLNGASEAFARTVAVNVFVFGEAFYLLNCRSLEKSFLRLGVFSNPWIWVGIGLTVLLQLAFTYLPFMNTFFHSQPIGLREWGTILMVSFFVFLIVELEKWCCHAKPARKTVIETQASIS